MNYISHHEVAKQYDPEATPAFLFGSFVTDLARMSKTRRLLIGANNPELLAGIKFHSLTNKPAFDDQPVISQLERDMKISFAKFLPWRSAIQASRAGMDILFDGIQFSEPRVVDDLFTTLDNVLANEVDFSGMTDSIPIVRAASFLRKRGPPRYDDTRVVAEGLFRTLSGLHSHLPTESFEDVVGVLDEHQPTVFAIGPQAMKQTVENLRGMDTLR
jgi:hypothetical protein